MFCSHFNSKRVLSNNATTFLQIKLVFERQDIKADTMFQIELIDIIYEIQPWFIEMSTRIEKILLDRRQMFEWFKTNTTV